MTRTPQQTAVEYVNCLRDGDFPRLVTLHDENLVCSLLGNSRVSGRYRGRDAFFAHTFKYVLGALAETDEVYLKDYRICCANDRYAALLLHGGLPTRSGGRYDQNYLQIFRVVDGKIREIHELLDSVMLETQIFGKTLSIPRSAPSESLRPTSRFSGHRRPTTFADGNIIEKAFAVAFKESDWEGCVAVLHPDAVLQIAGSTPASGVVHGRAAILTHIVKYFESHFKSGSLLVDPSTWLVCADETGFCRLATVSAELKNGQEYRQTLGLCGSYCGDSIGEMHLYFDTALEEAQTFGNLLAGGSSETADEPFSIDVDFKGH